jgi:hypothetical protein
MVSPLSANQLVTEDEVYDPSDLPTIIGVRGAPFPASGADPEPQEVKA